MNWSEIHTKVKQQIIISLRDNQGQRCTQGQRVHSDAMILIFHSRQEILNWVFKFYYTITHISNSLKVSFKRHKHNDNINF